MLLVLGGALWLLHLKAFIEGKFFHVCLLLAIPPLKPAGFLYPLIFMNRGYMDIPRVVWFVF
jgi:hypothetical protein